MKKDREWDGTEAIPPGEAKTFETAVCGDLEYKKSAG
jgi:hypothetical protein